MPEDFSTKGLDEFSQKFLIGKETAPEDIKTAPGQKASEDTLKNYAKHRMLEFVKKAAPFTDDFVAFFLEQRKIRDLTDEEAIFALALANINLREAYGNPQNEDEEEHESTTEHRTARLGYFDGVCYGAQQYYEANTQKEPSEGNR